MIKKILRYFLRFLLFVFIIGALIYFFFASRSQPMPEHPFFRADDPLLVFAHQGGDGERPSNTMMAFEHAVDIGVDVLEMDIHSSKDGVLVVIHDNTVDRTTDGTGRVNDFTFEELQQLDAGYNWPTLAEEAHRTDRPYRGQGATIPALEEIFQTFPQMRMTIEIKQETPSIVQPFCDMLRAYDMTDKVVMASFKTKPMEEFRAACPEVATSTLEAEVVPFYFLNLIGLDRAYQPVAHAFQVPEYSRGFHLLTPSFIEGARRHNVAVQPWTINSEEQMRRMIDLNVNGIMTDYPTLLMSLLGRQ